MLTQRIEICDVQRVGLDGLVLNLADYNELDITRHLRISLPAWVSIQPKT